MDFKTFVAFLLLLGFIGAQDTKISARIPCLDDDFCQKYLPNERNVKCNQNSCLCLNTSNNIYESCNSNGIAVPKIIQKVISSVVKTVCVNDQDCSSIAGSKCDVDGNNTSLKICMCPEKYAMSPDGLQCHETVYKINGTCIESTQCQAGLGQSECETVKKNVLGMIATQSRKCVCSKNSHYSKSHKKCVTTRHLGETCFGGLTDECFEENKNYSCHNNKCIDQDALVKLASGCTRKHINFGLVIVTVGSIFMKIAT